RLRSSLGGRRAPRNVTRPRESRSRAGRRFPRDPGSKLGRLCLGHGLAPRTPGLLTRPADPATTEQENMKPIESKHFGELDGRAVELYTLTNAAGRVLRLSTYGAAVTELHLPDRDGRLADVVLGFEHLEGYVQHGAFFGATVGRVANRIRAASFTLDGRVYPLAATDGADHLHGGRRGWNRAIWSAQAEQREQGPSLTLSHVSEDGDEG